MFLEPKPLPAERKGTSCHCGNLATRLEPTLNHKGLRYSARCGGCQKSDKGSVIPRSLRGT